MAQDTGEIEIEHARGEDVFEIDADADAPAGSPVERGHLDVHLVNLLRNTMLELRTDLDGGNSDLLRSPSADY